MREQFRIFESSPDRYSGKFNSLIQKAYNNRRDRTGENDINGVMVTKGKIFRKDVVLFGWGVRHDDLLDVYGKSRDESVVFYYSSPQEQAVREGRRGYLLVVAQKLPDETVTRCFNFAARSWPKNLIDATAEVKSPGTENDYPYHEHIIHFGSIRRYLAQ